jgi:hypothetical protein
LVEIMVQAAAVFSFFNVLLLIALLVTYGNSFRKLRAEFTAGLLFFSAFFLVQNLVALYSYVAMFMYFASDVAGLVLVMTVVQTAGLAILLWMSVR